MLSFWRIWTGNCWYALTAFWMRSADCGRRTHATNFVGVSGGVSLSEEVDPSERDASMPDRIAIPNDPNNELSRLVACPISWAVQEWLVAYRNPAQ